MRASSTRVGKLKHAPHRNAEWAFVLLAAEIFARSDDSSERGDFTAPWPPPPPWAPVLPLTLFFSVSPCLRGEYGLRLATKCPASPCGPPTTMKLILRCPSTGCGRMGLLRCPAMIDAEAVPTSVGEPAAIHPQFHAVYESAQCGVRQKCDGLGNLVEAREAAHRYAILDVGIAVEIGRA